MAVAVAAVFRTTFRSSAVQVLLFAGLRESCGGDKLTLDITLPTTVAELRAAAELQFPVLVGSVYRIAVDQRYARDEDLVEDGVEVGFLPPVSGG